MKKNLLILVFLALCVAAKAQVADTSNTVFMAVEHQPKFPGGEEAFGKFLKDHIVYPEADKTNHVQGKVYAQFIIEKDGSMTDIQILRTPSPAIATESIRVLKLMPKWKPGIEKGKIVRVQYIVPITFGL